jgi:hypothetical protein
MQKSLCYDLLDPDCLADAQRMSTVYGVIHAFENMVTSRCSLQRTACPLPLSSPISGPLARAALICLSGAVELRSNSPRWPIK